ncbi:MAG: hypothetical protein ACK5VV_01995 [Lysobacteraceae bacterium]|jgi:hypothetical protein|nr:hypothetical protein [Xanthomonadaceae bacterium]MCZ8319056.1 hypothetical protein [Silanimonas sp.]
MTGLFQRLHRLRPSRPRHPLLRIGFALLGLALVVLLVAGSVFIGLGMLAWRLAHKLRRPPAPAHRPGVIDGEFRVVDAQGLPRRTAPTGR